MVHDSLISLNDEYLVLRDFPDYVETQKLLGQTFKDRDRWLKMSIENIARAGQFSSDQTITRYAGEIWGLIPPTGGELPAAAGKQLPD